MFADSLQAAGPKAKKCKLEPTFASTPSFPPLYSNGFVPSKAGSKAPWPPGLRCAGDHKLPSRTLVNGSHRDLPCALHHPFNNFCIAPC